MGSLPHPLHPSQTHAWTYQQFVERCEMKQEAKPRHGAAITPTREVAVTVRERTMAPPQLVFDALADPQRYLDWGGAEASTLLSIDAPPGSATVGTEFTSTGEDMVCEMWDSSVVTEATPPLRFERVVDSAVTVKRSGKTADWVLVHRYELEPDGSGTTVTYASRLVRASALPGPLSMLGIPVLRTIALREWSKAAQAGLHRLIVAAEGGARA